MADKSRIEWTDATWNPIRGCSRVSDGCRNCYAETVANRFCKPGSPYEGVVRIGADGKGTGQWNGEIKFVEERLLDPLKWKHPRRIFVNSMSDLFHEKVTDEMLTRIFAVMALCPRHTFQVLTKRPERMKAYITLDWEPRRYIEGEEPWSLPNVWLGVSVEDQKTANARIPLLLQTPAAKRFLSAEPLLGEIDLAAVPRVDVSHVPVGAQLLHWVICGGESGPGARPMHPDWARSLRNQCAAAKVPFFFKQWGEWLPWEPDGGPSEWKSQTGRMMDRHAIPDTNDPAVRDWTDNCLYEGDEICVHQRVGKKAAGYLLDGKVYQQFPEVRA
jgi:protein gp37